MEGQVLVTLWDQAGGIALGTLFLFIGLEACGLAAMRRGHRVQPLMWLGFLSALYGIRILARTPAAVSVLPRSMWASRDDLVAVLTYLIIIPAIVFFGELSLGKLRSFMRAVLLVASAISMAGVCSVFILPSPYKFIPYYNIIVICFLLPLGVVNTIPSAAKRYLVIPSRILALGTVAFAAVVLYNNLRNLLHPPYDTSAEPFAFAVFVLSLGYVAADKIFVDERRLLSIEHELVIAREIQTSILPENVPKLANLHIVAAYYPMTAVAGDFYEFIPVDRNRVGCLVADVSGHGIPAALIASMIKVAMESVKPFANNPRQVLRDLNRILSGQLRGQFVSAAYLWLDMEIRSAVYSAAGHPPLLRWRDGHLDHIESNGLLLGVLPDSDYPICEIPLNPADRFLLYTDGVTEPEDAAGDSFGDRKLEQVIRNNQSRPPSELSDQLLSEIRRWQPHLTTQQDDITLIVIDVV